MRYRYNPCSTMQCSIPYLFFFLSHVSRMWMRLLLIYCPGVCYSIEVRKGRNFLFLVLRNNKKWAPEWDGPGNRRVGYHIHWIVAGASESETCFPFSCTPLNVFLSHSQLLYWIRRIKLELEWVVWLKFAKSCNPGFGVAGIKVLSLLIFYCYVIVVDTRANFMSRLKYFC